MAKTYYTVLTTYGAQLFAQAMANRQQVRITQFAVGDGNGRAVQPDSARTSLVRQVHRANISAVSPDPRNNKQVIFELTIPENVGGFWIREMGIYDNNNRLVAYANCPDTYKPQLSEGSGKIQVVRMILLVSSSNAVTLSVDDSVIFVTRGQLTPKNITATSQNSVSETGHTHHIDKATTTQAGITQLADNLTTNDNTKALTAAQGFALNEAKADKTLTIQVENAIYNCGSADDLLGQNKLVPINGGDREALGFKPEMYNFGLVASLGAGQAKILMYAPHSKGQLWIRNAYGNSKFEWWRVDGADWSGVRNKPTTLDGYGTTSNQPLTINNPLAHLKGQRNGLNTWFVGLANGETNDVQLHAYQSGNSLILKADRTESSKPLYVGNSKVFTESNLSPAKNIDLSATIPDTEIAYQDATPSQLPMGTYFGLSRNSRLNGELYSGWSMISRILNGGYAVRFGVNAGVFSYQDGDSGGWNSVKTVLNNEDLVNNLTSNDNTKALTAAQGKALNEAKADKTLTIQVENAIYNRGSADDLLGQNKVVLINGGEQRVLGFDENMYNFGTLLSLAAGSARTLFYAPHRPGQLWIRNAFRDNTSYDWTRVDGADWGTSQKAGNIRNKPTTLDGYATTSNQPLTINNPLAHLKGQRNGLNTWFVGLANGETNDVQLHAYQSGNSLILKADRTESSKPLYVGNSKVFTESNLSPAKNIELFATIPDTEIAYQDATPSQLPMGTYFGLSRNSRLNGELYSGWSMISRILNGGYAVRFGVNAGVFSYQDGDSGGWNSVKTVLNNEDLVNNLTTNDNSKVLTAAQGKVLNEAKADKATTLAGYGITDAVNVNALIGAVMYFAMTSPPEGWLKADGRAVSRTTYAELFARIGTTFGAGDGITTFNLPDLRGEFIRGWDNRRGVDRERSFGSFQFASMQALTSTDKPFVTGIVNKDNTPADIWKRAQHDKVVQRDLGYQDVKVSYTATFSWHGRNELGVVNNGNNGIEFGGVRPRNVALLACIKY